MRFIHYMLSLTLLLVCCGSLAQVNGNDEYALIGYTSDATHNRVARLLDQLASGDTRLEYHEGRGYLDSLLAALKIDPHSQTLVFSKTSLQYPLIDGSKPRAVYFNDDTYIGFVLNSQIVEVMTLDDVVGAVFYVFHNINNTPQPFERQNQRCLVCHDSNGAVGGGGTPLLLAQSSLYSMDDMLLSETVGTDLVTDKTPVAKRWGGWYVTGQSGRQTHLGNVRLQGSGEVPRLEKLLRINLPTLNGQGLPDTTPYPSATSDIVALLVLEHQLTVQNQLTYVRFKAPAVLARNNLFEFAKAATWAGLPERAQKLMTRMLDELVRVMLFTNAAEYDGRIQGAPEFQAGFAVGAVSDREGRSLRQFDLQRRLFRYPLSYLIYSEYFDTLPGFARDYVYMQLAAMLEGRRQDASFRQLTAGQRRDVMAILRATKPEFAAYLTR